MSFIHESSTQLSSCLFPKLLITGTDSAINVERINATIAVPLSCTLILGSDHQFDVTEEEGSRIFTRKGMTFSSIQTLPFCFVAGELASIEITPKIRVWAEPNTVIGAATALKRAFVTQCFSAVEEIAGSSPVEWLAMK